MLYCNEDITLVRCDGEAYTQTVIHNCSWFGKAIVTTGDKGLMASSEVKIRIPVDEIQSMFPQKGDYVVHEALASDVSSISDLSGKEYAKVMTVSDNRRGGLPHVGLSCS